MKPLPTVNKRKLVWPEPKPFSLWQSFKDAIFLIAGLLALLAVLGWMDARDTEARLEDQKRVTQKYIEHLSTAFNGRTLLDRESDTAFFFDKPAIVELRK